MLIDTHCHLSGLSDIDLKTILSTAKEHGVDRLIAIGSGYGFEDNIKTLELTKKYENIFCSLGMHPHEAKDMNEDQFFLMSGLIADNNKVVCIGETGLDYHYMHSPAKIQQAVFGCFIALACSVKKPLIVHDRECGNDCIQLIKEHQTTSLKGVVHCFSGSKELAKEYLDLGFLISFTGVITFPKAQELRDIIKYIPLDRLMVETDAPFLTPVPHRGKKNQPAYVKFVAEELARIKGLSFEDMANITTENAVKFFGLT